MDLTEPQKKQLRGLAHTLKPVLAVGNSGITGALINELDRCLNDHELIKVKVRVGEREARDSVLEQLTKHSGAQLIKRIGNIAIFYRARSVDPAITLPG